MRRPCRRGKSTASPELAVTGPLRTRFAPSPTGHLHLGSLRTALYNYLLARNSGGQFVLRIEDTDQARNIPGAREKIYRDLRWAGLEWDEGPDVGGPYGPYNQLERLEIYRTEAHRLLQSGHAFRCFCQSFEAHDAACKERRTGDSTRYDRDCAGLPLDQAQERAARGERNLIRLRPPESYNNWVDAVFGIVRSKKPKALRTTPLANPAEDTVLVRANGTATYTLANVVDDHYMNINLVLRGVEWIMFTAKHIYMYKALGWTPPTFGHLGLLMDASGEKLSKRTAGIDLGSFRDMGILPRALVNHVALLGWSHTADSDVMSLDDLVERISVKFTRQNSKVTMGKLWFLQTRHLHSAIQNEPETISDIVDRLCAIGKESSIDTKLASLLRSKDFRQHVEQVLRADAKNYTTLSAFFDKHRYLFGPIMNSHYRLPGTLDPQTRVDISAAQLSRCHEWLQGVSAGDWNRETLTAKIKEMVVKLTSGVSSEPDADEGEDNRPALAQLEKKWNHALNHYLRWALAEGTEGPSNADIMFILGRDETLARLATGAALVLPADSSKQEQADTKSGAEKDTVPDVP